MGRRTGLSGVLILGALVLVAAIVVGNSMGNRVVGDIVNRAPSVGTTPIPSPSASAEDSFAARALLRRRQALSVATDPAFPDPRITPEPYVAPTRRPVPRPKRTPTPRPTATAGLETPDTSYTAPPEPAPTPSLASDGNEAPGDAVSPPGRPSSPTPATRGSGSPPPHAATASPGRPGANQPRPYATLPPVTQPTLLP